ncbi:MAG: prolipoprotein diacylglyceryl transferase [Gammaproteobacteria bacterium]
MIAYPEIDPIIVSIGPLHLRWYGLMYVVGFAAAWWLGAIRTRRPGAPLSREEMENLIFWCALGVIIGGRVGSMLFYHPTQFMAEPWRIFFIWEGGMAFHGGVLGVVTALLLFARRYGKSLLELGDFTVPLIPIGLGAGRLGNFINGELWGRPTDVPWAMIFPRDPLATPRHPSQLYELALEGIALFVILWWFSARPRPAGAVSGLFLLGYGLFRFSVEFLREPDAHLGFVALDWMSMGQILSLPMILAGAGLMAWAYRSKAT